jgi:hypothetical protein
MSLRTRAAWASAVAAVVLGTTACAAQPAQDLPGCVVLDNLRERVVGQVVNPMGGPYPSIGDSATYVHQLYDADGSRVATVYGESNVRLRLADGGLLEYVDETIDFDDGTVRSQGYYELGDAAGTSDQYLPVIGTDGVFRDKLGRRPFVPLAAGQSGTTSLSLCPAGILK